MKRIVIFIMVLSAGFLILVGAPQRFKSLRETANQGGWISIGPEGGDIQGAVFNPSNKNIIYALAQGYPSKIFRSTDAGQNWTRLSMIDVPATSLAVDPLNGNILYVLHSAGVHKSTDAGVTWQESHFPDYTYGRATTIIVSPSNANVIYAVGSFIYDIVNRRYRPALFRSKDGGNTWSMKPIYSGNCSSGSSESLAVDPINSDVIYSGIHYDEGSGYSYTHHIMKSTDGGDNWIDKTGTITFDSPFDYIALVIDPTNPNKIYVGNKWNIYRSSDGGNNWSANNGNAHACALAIDSSNPNTLYAGHANECFKSTDGGVNWTTYYNVVPEEICTVMLVNGNRAYYGSSAGIYRTDDAGGSWKMSHAGLIASNIAAMCYTPSSANVLFTGITNDGLYKSANFGSTWSRLSSFSGCGYISRIVVNPSNANDLYILTVTGNPTSIYRSVDGANTLTKLGAYCLQDFTVNPNNYEHIFAAGQTTNYGMGLYKSLNSGSSWSSYKAAASGTAHSVAVDPNNDQVIYLGGDFGHGGPAAIFKSTNGGANWTDVTGVVDGLDVDALAVDASSTNRVYAGSLNGLFKSLDGGASWSKKLSKFVNCIEINPSNQAVIFIGGYDGVFRSLDYGETWREYNDGLTDMHVTSLKYDPVNNILYAGTYGGGVYRKDQATQVSMTIQATTGGTTNPVPGTYDYSLNTTVSIKATAAANYDFSGWTGDVSGTANPVSIVMNDLKSVTANFVEKIHAPLNFQGVMLENKSLLQVQYFNRLTWQANPGNSNISKYRIYVRTGSIKTLLAEVGASVFEYRHMNISKNDVIVYFLTAVNAAGREGEAATDSVRWK